MSVCADSLRDKLKRLTLQANDYSKQCYGQWLNAVQRKYSNYYIYPTEIDIDNFSVKQSIVIGCNYHGSFKMTAEEYLLGGGCPVCASSKGESEVQRWLKANGYEFVRQWNPENLTGEQALRFDFYLPTAKLCIEYDGRQHYEVVDYFGGKTAYTKLKKRDRMKSKWCLENDTTLIRIKYDQKVNVILDRKLGVA